LKLIDKMKFSTEVTNPTKMGSGVNTFTTYTIVSSVHGDNGETTSTAVRRFSDFVWLYNQLLATYKGLLVPPLPEKALIGRFDDRFVAERMRAMVKFMNRIGQTTMADDPSVELFLNADEDAFSAARGKTGSVEGGEEEEKSDKGPKKKGFFEKASEAVTSLSNSYGPGKDREKSDADNKADLVVAYASSLEKSLGALQTHSDSLVKTDKDLAKHYFELGLAFTELGQYETEQAEATLGGIYASVGSAADSISVLTTEKMEQETVSLKESVKDQVRMAGAVKTMIAGRTKLAVTHQTQTSALNAKQASLVKMQGQQGKEDKAQALEVTIQGDQAKLDATKDELDRVSDSALAEAGKFRLDKEVMGRADMLAFVKAQIAYHDQVVAAWKAILPNLEGEGGDGDGSEGKIM
jgi:sorting nexin-1/2